MVQRLIQKVKKHDHWSAEWWGGLFMICYGIAGLLVTDYEIVPKSFTYGFNRFLPCNMWQTIYLLSGFYQLAMLRKDSLGGRLLASFFSGSLLVWGVLNILIYGNGHYIMFGCAIFALINLVALARIGTGIEQNDEYSGNF